MKKLDRLICVVFTLCLIISSIICPAIIMMTRKSYYQNQFEKIDTMPPENEYRKVYYIDGDFGKTASLSRGQFDEIITHITSFLKGEKESFTLILDDVIINGETVAKASIFGEEAVEHMIHIRELYNTVKTIAVIFAVILIVCGVYMYKRKALIRECIYKWSLGTVITIASAAVIFLLFVLIKDMTDGNGISSSSYLRKLWLYMHHLFFPFNSAKFGGSFFDDALTDILTIPFFMNTVGTIAINLLAITTAWLVSAKIIRRKK